MTARSLTALAMLSLAVPLVATTAEPNASSMFRGNLQHTGVYDSPGAPTLSGVKWRFQTGGRVYASPAVAGDAVFVGSTDGSVYSLDRETGTLKWKLATKARVVSSPAVQDGTVYFESYDSHLYAVDAASGQVK